MKITKSLFAFALILTLVLSLSAGAFAEEAQFDCTRAFISELETVEGFTCTPADVSEDSSGIRYEHLKVNYAGGEYSDYESNLVMSFSENGEDMMLYMFNLITFDEEKLSDVLVEINELNASSTGVKLYVDLSDNTVTAEMYQLATPETFTDIAATSLGFMIGFTDSVYEGLSEYNTAA